MRPWIRPACLLLAVAALAARPTAARAYLIPSWDVDTLVNRSTVIVEGEVVGVQGTTLELRISRVYRGAVKEKDTLSIEAASHQKSSTIFLPKETAPGIFDPGDHLVCFLSPRYGRWERTNYPDRAKDLNLIGLRLITDGKVVNFSQQSNPGPAVAELGPANVGKQPALEDFRKTLEAAVKKDDATLALIQKSAAAKEAPVILGILNDRAEANSGPGEDPLALAAIDALVALHDYPALLSALMLKNGRVDLLKDGFYSPAGREFLLQAIADRKVDLPKRLACASVLPYHGLIENSPGTFARDPHYVARLAQLAADNVDAPELCVALAGCVGYFGNMGPAFNADIQTGMDILTRFYPTTNNQTIRYCIERALRSNSEAAYAALAAPGGPVIAIVQPDVPAQFAKPVGPVFRVRLAWEMYFNRNEPHTLQTEIFLQPLPGGEPISAGLGSPLTGHSPLGGSTDQPIVLPATLPAGKYRLYVQFSEDGKIVGQSHALDFDFQPK